MSRLGTLAQITDAHLRDEESPARAPLVDRISPLLNSTFRPQEALTPQVLAAAVSSVNQLDPDAVLETGDLIDSNQANEMTQALSVLNGGRVDPNSGGPGYDGVQELSNPDPFIYRPDIDAPRHPGLLDAAQKPFNSPGLNAPWYPVMGNHDLLVQGEVPSTPLLDAIATGGRQLIRLSPKLKAPKGGEAALTPALVDRYLANGLPGKTERVPADPTRRHLTAPEVLARLRGGSDATGSGPRLDYSFDVGKKLRVIALDVVRRDGGASGSVSEGQLRWLQSELNRAKGRYVIVTAHEPLQSSTGGDQALAALDADPDVIALITGHTHRNSIEPRQTSAGGYWLISSASLTDFPQQVRALRIAKTRDGVVIDTWMLDTAPGGLADISRSLAYLDSGGGRPQGDAGGPLDRNVRLFLARPQATP